MASPNAQDHLSDKQNKCQPQQTKRDEGIGVKTKVIFNNDANSHPQKRRPNGVGVAKISFKDKVLDKEVEKNQKCDARNTESAGQ